LGANHARDELGTTTQNEIINNGFPEAFAWRQGSFKSLMSITQATLDRRLYFSNPDVFVDGFPTGDSGTANNSATMASLAPAVSIFRQRPDAIFTNGFEQ